MTNREWYKDTLDTMLAGAIAVVDGKPETYDVGATSWSVDGNRTCVWKYMKLAEGNE